MWATFRPSDFHGTHGSLLSAKFLNSAVVYQASKVAITEIKFHWTAQDIHMPVRLTLAMPQHAIDTLMERYRQGGPGTLAISKRTRCLSNRSTRRTGSRSLGE
jgi:NADP-dependent 3-hydroxy acid dehydrogenase YdfG